MLTKASRLIKTTNRAHSLLKKYPQLAEQIKLYRESQKVSNSNDFKQIEKLMRTDYEFQEIKNTFEKDARDLMLCEPDAVTAIINLYFKTRAASGFSERLLVTLLKMLFANSRVNETWTTGTDIGSTTLYNSEKFLALMKDIRVLGTRNYVGNYSVSKTIIDNLRGMRYKNFEIVQIFTNKVYFELFKEEYLPGLFDSLETPESVHADALVYERFDKILESDQFSGFMDRVFSVVEFNPYREYNYPYSGSNEDIKEFESAVENVTKALGQARERYLKLFDAICQVRDYYMKLKEPEKFAFIKHNPQLLIDFLALEEQLIKAGFIMPKDVISEQSSDEITGLVLEQMMLQQGYDEEYIANLFQLVAKSGNEGESYKKFLSEGKLKEREDLFRLIYTLTDYVSFRTPYVDLPDIYNNSKFNQMFDRVVSPDFPTEFTAKLQYLMENNYRYVDVKNISIANYYYTKPFDFLRKFFQNVLSRLQLEKESPRALFYINGINKKLIIDSPVDNLVQRTLSTSTIDVEFLIDIISAIKFTDMETIFKILEKQNIKEMFNFINDRFSDMSTKFSYKSLLAQLLICMKLNPQFVSYKSDIDDLLKNLLKEENFEYFLNTDRKHLLPLSDEKSTVLMIFNFLKIEYNDFIVKEGLAEKLDKTLQFLYTNINLNWVAQPYYDPAYAQIMEALKNHYNSESDLTSLCFNYKDDLPEDVHPHFLFNNGNKLLGVYLINIDEVLSNGDLYFKKVLISHLFKKRFDVDLEIRFLEAQKLFKNSEYFVNYDFELNLDTAYIESVMRRDGDADIKKVLHHIDMLLENPENFNNDKLTSISLLKVHIQKIAQTFNKFGVVSQKLAAESIGQIRFMLHLLAKFAIKNETRTNLNTINSGLALLEHKYAGDMPTQTAYPFEGVRLGLANYKSNGYFAQKELEFLNYRFFKNTEYHVVKEWKDELSASLGPLDYFEASTDILTTDLANLKKVLLPVVDGRKIVQSNEFSFYWDYTSMGNDAEKQLAESIDQIVNQQNASKLTATQTHKVALLNFMYEFRATNKFINIFEQMFNLPFWEKFLNALMIADSHEAKSVFTDEIVSSVTHEKTQLYDSYRERIEQIKDVRDKLSHYQKLINEIIPREYASAADGYQKNMLYEYWNKVKLDYAELLYQYRDNFVEEYKTHKNTPYKDTINTLIYNHEDSRAENTEGDVEHLAQGSMLRTFDTVIKMFLLQTGLSTNTVNSLKAHHQSLIEQQTFIPSPLLFTKLNNVEISEIFDQEDYAFFNKIFPHSELSKVQGLGASDLMISLGLMLDRKVVEAHELRSYVNNVYKSSSTSASKLNEAIIQLFDNRLSNSSRFAHDYAQNYIHQKSNGLNDSDMKNLEEILKVMRGKLTRQEEK